MAFRSASVSGTQTAFPEWLESTVGPDVPAPPPLSDYIIAFLEKFSGTGLRSVTHRKAPLRESDQLSMNEYIVSPAATRTY
jgi:hypothetical protein